VEGSKLIEFLRTLEDISHIKDVDALLEQILFETRKIVNAEAGTLFLVKDNFLSFEYVQNDLLYGNYYNSNEYLYTKKKIPINNKSIAGYVALTKKSLVIDDVYKIPDNTPYSFNNRFDELSKYRTKSVLSVPLINNRNKVIGLLQIINTKDMDGKVITFTKDDSVLIELFARQAAVAIEKAIMTRELILRMVSIAELRDPQETGTHVNRVAAYSVEIYKNWAKRKNIPKETIKCNKDILRIAAMLHDVGKVAISDIILKKKGRLSEKEYEEMKFHTIFGAKLFENSSSEWDDMAKDISLNHHEKWDGSGYPGIIRDINKTNIKLKNGKKGEEISIFARIVALADVFDALISQRWYKKPWKKEKVFDFIKSESGKHFDPSVVDSFFQMKDRIISIWEKYS